MSEQFVNIEVTRSVKQFAIMANSTAAKQVNIEVSKIALQVGDQPEFSDFIPEQLTGTIDGENRIFSTTVPFEATTILVFLNGLKQNRFEVISESQIMLYEPPQNNGFTDCIEAFYIRKQILK